LACTSASLKVAKSSTFDILCCTNRNLFCYLLTYFICRTKLENQRQTLDMLERERAENAELRSRIQRLDAQYNAFVSGEQELIELNERLEREVDELRSQLEKLRQSSQKDLEHADQLVVSSRSSWTEEKCHLQSRVDELDVQLASALKKLTTATASYKQVFIARLAELIA